VPTRPPSLRAVAAFEAAARHENFSKAADELNLTQSAISHAIRALETRLGAQLFARVGKTVCLTPEGAHLARRVRLSLSLLTDALDRRPPSGRLQLVVGADPGVATRFLGPRLQDFRAAHPEFDLDLRCSAGAGALAASEIDVAIRPSAGSDLGTVSRMIVPERLCPVASPSCARLPNAFELPSCLLIESSEHPWSLWFSATEARRRAGEVAMVVETDLLGIEMARAGLGISLAPSFLIERDVRDGALVRLSLRDAAAQSAYHAQWSPRSSRLDEIAIFMAWLTDQFSAAGQVAAGLRVSGSPRSAPRRLEDRPAARFA